MGQPEQKPQLFRLSSQIWDAIDIKEIVETGKAMKELGIFKPPFNHFVLEMAPAVHKIFKFDRKVEDDKIVFDFFESHMAKIEFLYDPESENVSFDVRIVKSDGRYISLNTPGAPPEVKTVGDQIATSGLATLIVVLATRNVEKTTVKNDPKSRTHRVREDFKRHQYTTTIKIGKIFDGESDAPLEGRSSVRPHLRRGHIRNQRHGEGLSEVKKVFVQPCFVNADKQWVADRKDYRVMV